MKRIITFASVLLAIVAVSSCKSTPEKMADKFAQATEIANAGKAEKAKKLFAEIQNWQNAVASQDERQQFTRLILNK